MTAADVMRVGDLDRQSLVSFLGRFGIVPRWISAGEPITGSFWGDPEAGVVGCQVFLRDDTPVHSMLHEVCHIICMDSDRRAVLDRDAGGDDAEESAVCYLQVVLADYLDGVGRGRLMQDMDSWGYSFRLGSTGKWFEEDANDAREWLLGKGLLDASGAPQFRLRVD